jgi:peptide deformylase
MAQSAREIEQREREAAERRRAAVAQIRILGDPVLREKAAVVTVFDADLVREAEHMVAIMRDAPGVGLAATQLGTMHRLIVYAVEDNDPRALVNPQVVQRSPETEVAEEGCLSVPGGRVPIERAVEITVRAQDVGGRQLEFFAADFEARVIQHEVDHLDGVLILDRTTRAARAEALRAIRDGAVDGAGI